MSLISSRPIVGNEDLENLSALLFITHEEAKNPAEVPKLKSVTEGLDLLIEDLEEICAERDMFASKAASSDLAVQLMSQQLDRHLKIIDKLSVFSQKMLKVDQDELNTAMNVVMSSNTMDVETLVKEVFNLYMQAMVKKAM